jgi:hypothetical protein
MYFLVGQCERDRQVNRVAKFAPFYPLGGVHSERVSRASVLLAGHGGAFGHEQKANVRDSKIDQLSRLPPYQRIMLALTSPLLLCPHRNMAFHNFVGLGIEDPRYLFMIPIVE